MSFIWPAMLAARSLADPARRRACTSCSNGAAGGWSRATAASGSSGRRASAASGRLRRHIPAVLFLLGLAILIVALARPQAVLSLPRIEGTVILAFDVSGSMAADDIKPTPDGGGQGRRARVRRSASRRACRSASWRSATAAFRSRRRPTTRRQVLAAIDAARAPARHLARPGHPGLAQCDRSGRGHPAARLLHATASPEPTPDADAGAGRDLHIGRHRPAHRRREQRAARPARGRPGSRRPRRAHLHGRASAAPRARPCTSTASPCTRSSTRRRSNRSRRSPAAPTTTPPTRRPARDLRQSRTRSW